MPTDHQRLVHNDQQLQDDKTLHDYNIQDNSIILLGELACMLLLICFGGMSNYSYCKICMRKIEHMHVECLQG